MKFCRYDVCEIFTAKINQEYSTHLLSTQIPIGLSLSLATLRRLMKFILLALAISSFSFASTKTYETVCKNSDCFTSGWITTGPDYFLDTVCKQNDCSTYGWHSIANDKSTYDIKCKSGGCFKEGWSSVQIVNGLVLLDKVTCKSEGCLVGGWTVKTGYDYSGGNVTCHENDCSRFGGMAKWRGKESSTECYNQNCYSEGWTLNISDQ